MRASEWINFVFQFLPMQKSVNGNSEHEGGTWLSVCAAAVKKRVKVGYAITLCLDAG
jgi:hypothetical protein